MASQCERLKGKIAVVTGGNSGIGRGIVLRFIREGAAVALIGRDHEKGRRVLDEVANLGGSARFFAADLADEQQVADLVPQITAEFGALHILVNNAGIYASRSGLEPEDGPGVRWDRLRGANLDGSYFMSAYCLPALAAQKGAAIVNISSTATLHGNWGLYCVAKAGVEGLTRAFAAEGAPHGIRVNGISPGWIASDPGKEAEASGSSDGKWDLPPSLFDRMGTVDEIATAAVFLASDEASFVTGQTLIVDGGLSIIDYPSLPMLEKDGHRLQSQVLAKKP